LVQVRLLTVSGLLWVHPDLGARLSNSLP
jgi:hypothetical protein